uniref:Reverse transcriptase domain-containing protein n=1 Tax=Tanacetum cinerariifolium TaxID=118510 RepID=A0A6L2KFW4_TANCI|nr:reverse transcriptase domain-containing protein [Tanacetum cinerariifolium]GEU48391.1 reverse transcriptase domain-containing protein [Tanacetum cinerariifolium]
MRTRNSYFPNNSSLTIPRCRNKRRTPNVVEPEVCTIVEVAQMADNRTMEELLQAPTEGYGEAIVIPKINAGHFEIKRNLLQLVQANPYHGFERENPHTLINNFKSITLTLKFKDVPNDVIKLMMFSYSLEGNARVWYDKEPPNSILTWEDLALERFKEILRACPHHEFTELAQIDTFYNGLNDNDQDSLNAAAGENLLSKTTREAWQVIENKSKVRYSKNKPNVFRMNTTSRENASKSYDRIDKLADQISTLVDIFAKKVVIPAPVKAVEESCVTCGAMLLKKLLEKLGDPDTFLIPCDLSGMDVCHALADRGASINLMPLSIWKKLSLPELTPTRMTIKLADRSITRPKGVAEDVFVKVGKFHFSTDFVVVDFEADPRVPLILRRSLLRIGHALIDVYGEEITLQVNDEDVTFNLNQTTRYSSIYDDLSVNQIDIIDVAREEYAQEILGFSNNSSGGNPTSIFEPIIYDSSPSLTPFEGSDFILEEIEAYLKDESILPEIDHVDCDPERDICLIGKLLNDDPFQLPPMDLKQGEVVKAKSSIEEPPELELKDPWVSLIHCVPKKEGITVVENENNELIPTRPMTHLLEKETPFVFSKDSIDPFETLKKKLTEAPILVVPDWNLPFELMRDASDFAIDHSALKYLLSKQDAKPRLIRWVLLLQELDIIIYDKKGQENLAADHLSRLENPHKDVFENKEINENFPLETLGKISSGSTSWFADFANFLLMISSKLVMNDPPRAIMVPISSPRKTPRAIINDRGTHFCNDKFAKVTFKYEVTHRLATAYHPQTSRQVEVSNRDDALWDFRTDYKTPIGCTPYKLVYGKSCHSPIKLEHKAYWALKHVNFDLKITSDHRKLQLNELNELNELRDQAYENSLIYKEKTKKFHNSKIKNRIFNVGDRVLLFNSRLKIFSEKLKTRWSGPFTIIKVFPYGTVELSQPDGPNFKVNGHRVKHYFEGDVPQLIVPDLQTFPMDK